MLRGLFVLLLAILFFISGCGETPDYVIEGDKVYFEDSNVYLSASPHTLASGGWLEFTLTSKQYTGEVDVVWGFDAPLVKPEQALLYDPYDITTTHKYTCDCEASTAREDDGLIHSYGACWFNNTADRFWCWQEENISGVPQRTPHLKFDQSYDWVDVPTATAYWNRTKKYSWRDISNRFGSVDYEYGGMTKWWFLKNVSVVAGETYRLKAKIDMPATFKGSDGKYWWAVKRSQDTLAQAISSGRFYALDPWFNSSFLRRKTITIDSSVATSDLTDYPILIDVFDTDLHDDTQTDGDDIVFTNTSGSVLDYEIELFNQTYNSSHAHLVAWVRVPALSASANTVIQMYYNNSAAANQEDPTNVWDNNFVAVWHMNQDPNGTAPQMNDSTANNYDANSSGVLTSDKLVQTGIADGTIDLDNPSTVDSSEGFDVGTISISDNFTLEGWFNAQSFPASVDERLLTKQSTIAAADHDWMIGLSNSGSNTVARMRIREDSTTTTILDGFALSTNTWYYEVGRWNGSTALLMINIAETAEATLNGTLANNAHAVGLGNIAVSETGEQGINGRIDELRVSNISRSIDWLNTTYKVIGNNSVYISFSTEQTENGTCAYVSGNYEPLFSDNCVINTTVDAGGNICIISGDPGTFTVTTGGHLICKELHITPPDFDGDTVYAVTGTGRVSIQS